MPDSFKSGAPAELPRLVTYNLMTSVVQPRPIAFVSTISQSGYPNLAPFSYFTLGGATPPSLCFCPVLGREGEPKDTLRNILETGEFVVSTVHMAMAEGMNQTSGAYGPEVNEWDLSGFTPVPSVAVKPARVKESFAQFECRLHQVVEHGQGAGAARYVIGEIVQIHIAEEIWQEDGLVSYRPITRMGGAFYLDTESLEFFELERP